MRAKTRVNVQRQLWGGHRGPRVYLAQNAFRWWFACIHHLFRQLPGCQEPTPEAGLLQEQLGTRAHTRSSSAVR